MRKIMRKIISIGMFVILVISLAGCTKGSYKMISGEVNNTSTQMAMNYKQFTGHNETEIKVKDGEEVKVSVKIVTDGGNLDAYIAKDNNSSNSVYKGNDIKTSSFTVTLKEAGTYTLRVDGDKHSGSYSFNWGQ